MCTGKSKGARQKIPKKSTKKAKKKLHSVQHYQQHALCVHFLCLPNSHRKALLFFLSLQHASTNTKTPTHTQTHKHTHTHTHLEAREKEAAILSTAPAPVPLRRRSHVFPLWEVSDDFDCVFDANDVCDSSDPDLAMDTWRFTLNLKRKKKSASSDFCVWLETKKSTLSQF